MFAIYSVSILERQNGIANVLKGVSGLDEICEIAQEVIRQYELLKKRYKRAFWAIPFQKNKGYRVKII